jgi:tetratricopeptide (TPR) repeat protein
MTADSKTDSVKVPRSNFVGREEELSILGSGIEDAESGRGRLFLISGEPGIGKSRLAEEAAELARKRGFVVLWGRCWEAGGAPAYWPWVQSLRSYIRSHKGPDLRAYVGSGGGDLAQMLPDLREPPALDPDSARFRLFDATATLLQNASGPQPLALVLDDLHVADVPSLLLLQFVARVLPQTRVLLIGVYRDPDFESVPLPRLPDALGQLAREATTTRLALAGLPESDVGRFIEMTAGRGAAAALVSAVYRETEGNPLFLGEVVSLLAQEGSLDEAEGGIPWRMAIPRGVKEVIGRRLGHLSTECRGTLTVGSVLGREFGLDMLQQVSGLQLRQVLDVSDEALSAGLVSEVPGTPGRMRFAHALIRDVLYDGLPAGERIGLHQKVAQAIETLHSEGLDPYLAELAHHSFEALPGGDIDRAIDFARRAAERGATLLAYEEAARLYQMALEALKLKGPFDEVQACDLLLSLGDAQGRAGDLRDAKATFLRAETIARERGIADQLAQAALGYGGRMVMGRAGEDPHLVPSLEYALKALGEREDSLRVRLLARLAGALRDEYSPERRIGLSRKAVDIARRLGDPGTLAYALDGQFGAMWGPDSLDELLALSGEMIAAGERAGDLERRIQGYIYRVMLFLEQGDIRAAYAEHQAQARLADELRQGVQKWFTEMNRTLLALFEGRFAEGERLAEQAFVIGQRALSWQAVASYSLQKFVLLRERGELASFAAEMSSLADQYEPSYPMFRAVLALLLLDLGREDDARPHFETFATVGFDNLGRDNEWLFGTAVLGEVAARLEEVDQCAVLYERLLPYEGRNVVAPGELSIGALSRYLGLLAVTLGRHDEARRHYEEALEMNRRIGARPWVAYTQYDYARMLLTGDGSGGRKEAAGLLRDAHAACQAMGMTALGQKVSVMLKELGIQVAEPGVVPVDVSAEPQATGIASFRREGEYWAISHEREAVRLRDTKGLRYVAHLLARPGEEVHVLELVAAVEGRQQATTSAGLARAEGLSASGAGAAGAALDAEAALPTGIASRNYTTRSRRLKAGTTPNARPGLARRWSSWLVNWRAPSVWAGATVASPTPPSALARA